MSQIVEQETAVEERMPTERGPKEHNEGAQDAPGADIFSDGFTEEMLAGLAGDTKKPAPRGEEQVAAKAKAGEEAAKPAAPPAEAEAPATESAAVEDGKYALSLFGKDVELDGDQLSDLAEAGAQFMRHRPQVEKAMRLFQAVENDPGLQSILAAYAQGRPLPSPAGKQAAPEADPQNIADPVERVRAQIMAELGPQLRQQLMADIQQHYKPFVDNVNGFADEHRREKEFGKYAADPDYAAVNDLMQSNIQGKVAEGVISLQDAARIDAALKADPQLYGEWFGRFKAVVGKGAAASTQPVMPGETKTVARAPRLEAGQGVDLATQAETINNKWKRGDRQGAFASALLAELNP